MARNDDTQSWQRLLRTRPEAERSEDAEFWDEVLAQRPDVLHRLLADVYRAAYGVAQPPSLEALWDLFDTPEFAAAPFPEAATELLARKKQSQRWLAQQSGTIQQVLQRYLSGTRPIVNLHDPEGSMRRIESLAKPLGVHPSYFSEWRRLWIMTLFDSAFTARPDMSADIFKRFSGFGRRTPSTNARSNVEAS